MPKFTDCMNRAESRISWETVMALYGVSEISHKRHNQDVEVSLKMERPKEIPKIMEEKPKIDAAGHKGK